ncbi:MAG TPA: cupin domain-containing protein [Mycobacterium sp.]|uniref:cupin domain-containing protein n=1 Tax=Mycolicibacterium sp. TaxID=2320850 RepID=UPI0025D925BA|nr:cupin domain-containing protein [Mycolicibacterium sp.]HPX36041.1 cupin domain-containing protein [Mycobacterium sp.]HQC75844.1 cupin domain-containing protein [Mycobacterium sp.]
MSARTVLLLATATLLTSPVAHAELGSTTTVNGDVPPGVPAKLVDLTVVTDTVQVDGDRLLVMQGVRKVGTRAPIHYHDHGGRTCVLKGTITDFVEGLEPAIFPAGTCYDMPADTPMTAANLGDEDVLLVDTFVLPPTEPTIIVLEPNWPDLADPTG